MINEYNKEEVEGNLQDEYKVRFTLAHKTQVKRHLFAKNELPIQQRHDIECTYEIPHDLDETKIDTPRDESN